MATKSAAKNLETLTAEREKVSGEILKLKHQMDTLDPLKGNGMAELEKLEDLLARRERFVRLLDDKLVVARQDVLKEQEAERKRRAAVLTKRALKIQADCVGHMLALQAALETLDGLNSEIQAVGGLMLRAFDTDIRTGIKQVRQNLQRAQRAPVDPLEEARRVQERAVENQKRRVAELEERNKKLRRPYVLKNAIEKAKADLALAERQLERIEEAA